jgi:hypothetical protein
MRLLKLTTALALVAAVTGLESAPAAAVTVVEGTPAAQCKGNACASVLFEVRGGCFTATNLGGKRIAIAWGGYDLKVGAGESKSIKKDGSCVHDVGGPLTATFG